MDLNSEKHRETIHCHDNISILERFNFLLSHRNIFPDNIVSMTINQTQTTNEEQYETVIRNSTNEARNETIRTLAKTVGKTSGTNLLGTKIAHT